MFKMINFMFFFLPQEKNYPTSRGYAWILKCLELHLARHMDLYVNYYYGYRLINRSLRIVRAILKVPQVLNGRTGPSIQIFSPQSSWIFFSI